MQVTVEGGPNEDPLGGQNQALNKNGSQPWLHNVTPGTL